MRTFGRQCRGKGKVYLKWVRETEKRLLSMGCQVVPFALSAQIHLQKDIAIQAVQRDRLMHKLDQGLEAHRHIEKQSRQLVNGKKLDHIKIVNAYDPTIAPIKKGKSNCACQFGKKPGIIAEMGTGFIFGYHLPPGNPNDASYVMPLVQTVETAIHRIDWKYPRRKPRIRSLCGDCGLDNPNVRKDLHQKGITTLGIPTSADPIPKVPSPEMIKEVLDTPILGAQQNTTQIKTAYACAYSRPFVEGVITTLSCRGATQIKYKGPRGADIQIGMAIVAANAATLVRIKHDRISKRAQKFRTLFRLKPHNSNKNNNPNV